MCTSAGAIILLKSKVISECYSMRPKLPDYSPHEMVWHQDAGLRADGSPNTEPAQDRMDALGPGAVDFFLSKSFTFAINNVNSVEIPSCFYYQKKIEIHSLCR